MQWLISPSADLLWVLGSVAVAWAMFAAWWFGLLTTEGVMLLWVFAFHGPHFWATLSRTYADREQFQRRRQLFVRSLVWYAIGPAVVGLGLLLQLTTGRRELVQLFFFLAAVWAFHHVAKQHFGFLALYRAKHREFNRRDFVFHKYYLLTSLWMPALIILGTNVHWLIDVPFAYNYASSSAAALSNIQRTQVLLRNCCTWIFWGAQIAYGASLVWRIATGRGINLPLLLLVACCVPLNWCVISLCNQSSIPGAHFVLVPILTTYHNLQYHGLVWHYNRTRYASVRDEPSARKRFGWAIPLNRNFAVYAFFGLVYTSLTIGIERYGILSAGTSEGVTRLVQAFFWGFAFHHYYLDAKIWHASADAELRTVLGFQAPAKPRVVEPTGPSPALVTPAHIGASNGATAATAALGSPIAAGKPS